MRSIKILGILILIGVGAAACSPIVDARGHNTTPEDFKQIIIRQSTAEDVRAILGSPSASSSFGEETWYYISQRKETKGPFAPKIADHHVYAIRFDANHVVADISEYSKEAGKPVTMVEKTTPAEGNQLTFTKQLFGNFGRFSAPGRGISSRNLGR